MNDLNEVKRRLENVENVQTEMVTTLGTENNEVARAVGYDTDGAVRATAYEDGELDLDYQDSGYQ